MCRRVRSSAMLGRDACIAESCTEVPSLRNARSAIIARHRCVVSPRSSTARRRAGRGLWRGDAPTPLNRLNQDALSNGPRSAAALSHRGAASGRRHATAPSHHQRPREDQPPLAQYHRNCGQPTRALTKQGNRRAAADANRRRRRVPARPVDRRVRPRQWEVAKACAEGHGARR